LSRNIIFVAIVFLNSIKSSGLSNRRRSVISVRPMCDVQYTSYAFESRCYLWKLHIYVKSGNDVVRPYCVSHLNSRDPTAPTAPTAVLANIDTRTRFQSINIWNLPSFFPWIYRTIFLEPVTQFYRRRCLRFEQDSLAAMLYLDLYSGGAGFESGSGYYSEWDTLSQLRQMPV
jgi:hypothetical protein